MMVMGGFIRIPTTTTKNEIKELKSKCKCNLERTFIFKNEQPVAKPANIMNPMLMIITDVGIWPVNIYDQQYG